MSQQTWVKEFYPIPASSTLPDEAAAHSLRKWEGFTQGNLYFNDLSSTEIYSTADTCALLYRMAWHMPTKAAHSPLPM